MDCSAPHRPAESPAPSTTAVETPESPPPPPAGAALDHRLALPSAAATPLSLAPRYRLPRPAAPLAGSCAASPPAPICAGNVSMAPRPSYRGERRPAVRPCG